MKFLTTVLVGCLLPSILVVEGNNDGMDLPSCDFPAVYNFGDSNSDTRGIAAAFFPTIEPFGDTYFHRPTGRASDGRLIIDFIAEQLGIPHLSAYLDSVGTSYRHGANFATGGATIRRQDESWFANGVSPFPLDIQVEHYTQFKARTSYFYNQAKEETDRARLPVPEHFSKALYTMDIGQNDLAAGFRKMNMEQLHAAIPDIVNQLTAQVRDLYNKGARNFWIHNTAPIGCLPVSTTKIRDPKPGELDEQGCVKAQNEAAMEFNRQLKDSVVKLRAELSQAALTYVDMYHAKYELIKRAKNQGFEDPFKICCGYHDTRNDVWCGHRAKINNTEVYAGSCEKPSAAVSWDGVHYSEAANNWVASQIVNGTWSDPPIPITRACHRPTLG
nr:GDSL esterase/lipase At5g14450-like [Ipomoea batatas]